MNGPASGSLVLPAADNRLVGPFGAVEGVGVYLWLFVTSRKGRLAARTWLGLTTLTVSIEASERRRNRFIYWIGLTAGEVSYWLAGHLSR